MAKFDINELKKKSVKIEETDFSKIDGAFLRDLRMRLNMSQTLFASYLGVSKKAIEKWEQGINKVNPPTVRLLFLIDRSPSILSLFKRVSYLEKYDYVSSYANDYKITVDIKSSSNPDSVIDSSLNDWSKPDKWRINVLSQLGGPHYGSTSI